MSEDRGIIAIRSWNINGDCLSSTATGEPWQQSTKYADSIPSHVNQNGIYCYPIDQYRKVNHAVVRGVVEIGGKLVEHTDNIIRAEKCRILRLFVPIEFISEALANRYGDVAIIGTNNPAKALEEWAKSKEAKRAEVHNQVLLKEQDTPAVPEFPNVTIRKYKESKSGSDDPPWWFGPVAVVIILFLILFPSSAFCTEPYSMVLTNPTDIAIVEQSTGEKIWLQSINQHPLNDDFNIVKFRTRTWGTLNFVNRWLESLDISGQLYMVDADFKIDKRFANIE